MIDLHQLAPRADQTPSTPPYRRTIGYPGAWKTTDFKSPRDYTIELTTAQLDDIDDAVRHVRASGLGLDDIDRSHFPLPSLAPVFERIRREITDGLGFVLVGHLPVERYTKDELGMIYWGLGTHLGRGLSQSVMGDRLGHVKDMSREDPNARAYRNKQELSPHTDLSDLVGLLCLRTSRVGGTSRLTSALAVHDAILAEHPHYLDRLYRGYVYHRRGEERPGDLPVTPHPVPVFCNVDGHVSVRYVRTYVEAGMAAVGSPIDDFDREVLDFFERTSKRPDLMLEFTLEPGQMYFLNNYTVLHARTEFEDFDEEDRRRHLLRLWLEVPGMRSVHPHVHLFDGQGIAPVAGRTPSYDWGNLTTRRG
ncbi:MAG TPA: TauD/TfdA family dioxygenase [Candidatus Methylomirabilis sp.]|nr:TauD/TfdA family dioxygenase [Candidatus Methylomirabilis sp.]